MNRNITFLVACGIAMTESMFGQYNDYPSPSVVQYVNLDDKEVRRQAALQYSGLQSLASVALPEGEFEKEAAAHGGPSPHFGWPHAVMQDSAIIIHVKHRFLIRSPDRGLTWEKPVFVKNAPILVMTATRSGKLVAISIDRDQDKKIVNGADRTLSVLISKDNGKTWNRNSNRLQLPTGAQGLTSRIIEHPRFGLISGVHYNSRNDILTFLVSDDEGETWRAANFPSGYPLKNNGVVVFEDGRGGFGAIVRNHMAIGGEYLKAWTSVTVFVPVNLATAGKFEDLVWSPTRSNIWLRKEDSYGAQYNPVSNRIEAVATKREWGEPQIDRGYMTINLWSISPEALHRGETHWRYEGALLRSKGEKARLKDPRDGFHPAGTVIDTLQGMQHIFFYSGNRAHGGDGAPDAGRTGIFRLSRTLDTKNWVKKNRELENYTGYSRIEEDFDSLEKWERSGSPTGRMVLDRIEPAFRLPVTMPECALRTRDGIFSLKTESAGYFGFHREDIITSVNFRLSFKARILRFAGEGYPLGVHVNTGAEKFDLIIRPDSVYQLTSEAGKYKKVIDQPTDHQWHEWLVLMRRGHAEVFRDGRLLGATSVRLDGALGERPLSISVVSTRANDRQEMEMDNFRFEILDQTDEAEISTPQGR